MTVDTKEILTAAALALSLLVYFWSRATLAAAGNDNFTRLAFDLEKAAIDHPELMAMYDDYASLATANPKDAVARQAYIYQHITLFEMAYRHNMHSKFAWWLPKSKREDLRALENWIDEVLSTSTEAFSIFNMAAEQKVYPEPFIKFVRCRDIHRTQR